ncbi:hypothetical protein OS493_007627 [Desmophyllum pertusum]|uniref:Uncharacterized protein n=1 Tax=Desmophyllum pertusum TaxID=174260 RepID=A0A9X0CM57_9CNID|nr:hypothetical protein OS493_007627 [Desmophyllum pertusum]
MATNYELPEEINEKRLRTLGRQVEMQTYKTNAASEGEAIESDQLGELLLKIACVGTKGVFIDDYLQVWPPVETDRPPLIGANYYLKILRWQRSEAEKAFSIKLQLWEIAEHERFGYVSRVFLRNSRGALVFWGTRRPSSLDEAVRWSENVKEFCPLIPCVLVTDNVAKEPLQWIGPGKIFESEAALDEFCKDHGFVDHFEIKSRDWESGRKAFSDKL